MHYLNFNEQHIVIFFYNQMVSIKSRNEHKKRLRDVTIQRHLLSYARSDVDQMIIKDGDDDIQSTAALAQVGQRILTALRNVSNQNRCVIL